MKSLYRFAIVATAAWVIFPCSFDTSPGFLPRGRPEQVDKRFMRGELGILTPALEKRYELVAWRYLSDLPLNANEQVAPPSLGTEAPGSESAEPWLTVRNSLPGMQRHNFILTSKNSRIASAAYYNNCLPDAFTSAAETLKDRQQRYVGNDLVLGWVRAQDIVFDNCELNTPVYPADPEPGLPPLARADRLYQIAAAHFYAEDLEGAESRFREIGDTYMVARTLLRKFSLLGDKDALPKARALFGQIASTSPLYQSARGLQRLVDALNEPAGVYGELAERLSIPHPGPDFGKTVLDAVYAMTTNRYRAVFATLDPPDPFDWVRSLESHQAAHAIDRWKEDRWNATHSTAWLTVALINAAGNDPAAASLIEAGLKVPATSPAFDTARFNSIRLMIERGERTAARQELQALLAKKRPLLSVDNAYRGQRMNVARDFSDFLRWAPRHPIRYADDNADPGNDEVNSAPVLDLDSVSVLNHLTPLAKLADAAESPILPSWIAIGMAHVAWTRAFLLGDNAVAERMRPILKKAHPDWASDLVPGDFRGAMLILRHSQMTDRVSVDFEAKGWPAERSCPLPVINIASPASTVLTLAERERADREYQLIRTRGTTQAALAPIVMDQLKSHPDDPDIPEALHRVVLLTRYGCRPDPRNTSLSKQAFDTLHARFPRNPWTARTPYWFKD